MAIWPHRFRFALEQTDKAELLRSEAGLTRVRAKQSSVDKHALFFIFKEFAQKGLGAAAFSSYCRKWADFAAKVGICQLPRPAVIIKTV